MKSVKVFLALLLICVMAFSTACGSSNTQNQQTQATAAPATEAPAPEATAEPAPEKSEPVELVFATSTTGGTWYSLGAGLANLWNENLDPDVHVFAQSSGGSTENAQMLLAKEVDMCILGGLARNYYYNGTNGYPANPDMRAVTCMQFGSIQWVVTEDHVKTGTVTDIDGLRFAIVPGGSGELHFNLVSEAVGGLTIDAVAISQSVNSDSIKNGTMYAGAFDGGAPTSGLMDLMSTNNPHVRILDFTQEIVDKMNEITPGVWTFGVLPVGTYDNMDKEAYVAQSRDAIVCDKSVSADAVYKILEVTYSNYDKLQAIHSGNSVITLDNALKGVAIPLHPGAVQYFRDQGIEIPDELIPPEMK